jgi:hypothetical protein
MSILRQRDTMGVAETKGAIASQLNASSPVLGLSFRSFPGGEERRNREFWSSLMLWNWKKSERVRGHLGHIVIRLGLYQPTQSKFGRGMRPDTVRASSPSSIGGFHMISLLIGGENAPLLCGMRSRKRFHQHIPLLKTTVVHKIAVWYGIARPPKK